MKFHVLKTLCHQKLESDDDYYKKLNNLASETSIATATNTTTSSWLLDFFAQMSVLLETHFLQNMQDLNFDPLSFLLSMSGSLLLSVCLSVSLSFSLSLTHALSFFLSVFLFSQEILSQTKQMRWVDLDLVTTTFCSNFEAFATFCVVFFAKHH